MIPRLFLDYHLPTLNFKLQLHTYPPVRSTLSYLTYSLVPFVIRLDVKLFFTIDHGFFFFAHLGPHQSDTACSSRLVLCSRMPSPPLQSFFTPNPTTRAIARRRNVATLYSRVKQATSFSQVAYCTTFSLPIHP